MPTTSVESLQALNNSNVLKLHVGAAIFGDITAPLITSLFAADGSLNALPAGYYSAGLTDTSGITTNRSITVDEVMSWQSVETQRADVSADKLQIQVKFQEALNPVVAALQEGVTIDAAQTAVAGGTTYSLDKNTSGVQPYRRLLLLAKDQTRNVVVARFLPSVMLSSLGSQAWQRSTEVQVDTTFDCFVDTTLGTASRYFVGGTGLAALEGQPYPAWQATHAYNVGDLVSVGTGPVKTLRCTTAGTSASTVPTAPATVGGTVIDGTVGWTRTA